jgi:hypothetical protein
MQEFDLSSGPPPRPKPVTVKPVKPVKRSWLPWIIAAALTVILLAVAVAVFSRQPGAATIKAIPGQPAKEVGNIYKGTPISRDAFRERVGGAFMGSIREDFGTPDTTSEDGGTLTWTYLAVTFDPVTSRIDRAAVVTKRPNHGTSVAFIP